MRCIDRHHKGDNRRGLVILKSLIQGEYEASNGLVRMETETLRRSGARGGGRGSNSNGARCGDARPPEPASRAC